jgi:oligopeptide transport system permease protein
LVKLKKRSDTPASLWSDAWHRMRRNKAAMVGLFTIVIMTLSSIFAPLLTPYAPLRTDFTHLREPPSWAHPLGTDLAGRDMLSRVLYGGRMSLAVGVVSQLAVMLVGMAIGAISGFYGKFADTLIMRFTDIMYAFPTGMLQIILMIAFGRGFWQMILAMTITSWVTVARLVRGEVLQLKQREFIEAARSVGARDRDLIWRHLFPNLVGPMVVWFSLGIPGAIMAEAGLSFLGIGLVPPTPSWGIMMNQGNELWRWLPYMILVPAAVIAIVMISFTMLGDGLRDALDPHMSR